MHHRLVLDIDCTDDSVSGRITDDRGRDVPFVGWLGLAGALEIVTTDPREAAPPLADRLAS